MGRIVLNHHPASSEMANRLTAMNGPTINFTNMKTEENESDAIIKEESQLVYQTNARNSAVIAKARSLSPS